MNDTNRAVNRIVLIVVGLILLAAGAATALAALWPAAGEIWKSTSTTAVDWMTAAYNGTPVSENTVVNWFALGILAVLLLLVVSVIAVIANLGGGKSAVVVREDAPEDKFGPITIRGSFASEAITNSLSHNPAILSARVTSRKVKGEDVLHVSVTPRQNTSPTLVASTVSGLVDNLAELLGRPTPTVISIHSGVRARLASDQSRVD